MPHDRSFESGDTEVTVLMSSASKHQVTRQPSAYVYVCGAVSGCLWGSVCAAAALPSVLFASHVRVPMNQQGCRTFSDTANERLIENYINDVFLASTVSMYAYGCVSKSKPVR